MEKIGLICPRSRFFWEKKLKKCLNQKMTKGNIVLELVNYVKSAVRKFRPIRSLHSKSHDHNGGLWLVEIFWLQIWHIWAILRQFYPWSNFDPGIISKKNLKKTDFWSNVYKFFSWWHKDNVHNEQIWRLNFHKYWNVEVLWWNFSFLLGLFLIG